MVYNVVQEVRHYRAIKPLHFPVVLRMIGGHEDLLHLHNLENMLKESHSELSSIFRQQLMWRTRVYDPMCDEGLIQCLFFDGLERDGSFQLSEPVSDHSENADSSFILDKFPD